MKLLTILWRVSSCISPSSSFFSVWFVSLFSKFGICLSCLWCSGYLSFAFLWMISLLVNWLAGLVVVSSKDEEPINKFIDLFNTGQLPSLLNDGAMDPQIMKYYLLLHDNQDGTPEKYVGSFLSYYDKRYWIWKKWTNSMKETNINHIY